MEMTVGQIVETVETLRESSRTMIEKVTLLTGDRKDIEALVEIDIREIETTSHLVEMEDTISTTLEKTEAEAQVEIDTDLIEADMRIVREAAAMIEIEANRLTLTLEEIFQERDQELQEDMAEIDMQ